MKWYKISTQSDQWFLRYKRKWDLNFDLHLHNQDGRISTWIVRQWPEVDVYWIWSIYDEWLCRYEWWSEITKWRLDDVMVGWSGWKGYCIHSSSGQRCCENLKMIAHSVFEISSTQNSWDLSFDPHLHSQDGLMSTCHYVIWLADRA